MRRQSRKRAFLGLRLVIRFVALCCGVVAFSGLTAAQRTAGRHFGKETNMWPGRVSVTSTALSQVV